MNDVGQRHFFTVDVEDYFQVSAFESVVARDSWSNFPGRVQENTQRLLEILERHDYKGTFFILGWVAARYPRLVRRIVDAGHEVGSHGYWHRRVYTLSPEEFGKDLRESKYVIEQASGRNVQGFRAPSFSISMGMMWAFETLLDAGYTYDSSIFPIRRPGYGSAGAPRLPYSVDTASGSIREFPMATTQFLGARIPAAGGAYFRHLPFSLSARALSEHDRIQIPGMFYIHPWEVDPDQPRIRVSTLTRIRHYGGLARTMPRLERLLTQFSFGTIEDFIRRNSDKRT